MKAIDELLFQISIYLEKGIDFFVNEVLTIEGVIAMVFAFFITSLIVQIRS